MIRDPSLLPRDTKPAPARQISPLSYGPGNLCSPSSDKEYLINQALAWKTLLPIGPEIPFPHLEAQGGSAWRHSIHPLKAPPAETNESCLK